MSSRALQEALAMPIQSTEPQGPTKIVAGVLTKWVNLGQGWRHRLFVLRNGVLRYYRVMGLAHKANIHQMFEVLRSEGDLQLIGAEASILENKWRKQSNGTMEEAREALADPQAEVHLQVADIEASQADHCKLYIHTKLNNITYRMKAETTDDRRAWFAALNDAKVLWGGRTPSVTQALVTPSTSMRKEQEEKLRVLLAEVEAELRSRGASPEVQKYVADVLRQHYTRYNDYMSKEADMRRELQRYVTTLENQHRELETAVVVESQAGRAAHPSHKSSDPSASSDVSGPSDDEGGKDHCDMQSATHRHSHHHKHRHGGDSGSPRAAAVKTWLKSAGHAVAHPAASVQQRHSRSNDAARFYSDDDEEFYDCSSSRRSSSADVADAMAGLKTASGSSERSQDGKARIQGDTDWIEAEGPPPHRRERLPTPKQKEKSVSLWAILKEVVGKDLSKVCLPVYFNEPLSALQKMAEELEYSELLDKAMTFPPASTDRLLHIAAFAVSGYSGTAGRTTKPFNPLLGETFEFVCQEKGLRILAEKVVHHPTIIAGHAEGRRWTLDADSDLRSKFWGRSIELMPVGTIRVLTDDGEEYSWNKVTTTIGNLILGKIYVDHGGIMKVRNHTAGLTARLAFKEQGLLRSKDLHQVTGTFERGKQKLAKPVLSGKWDEGMVAELEDGSTVQMWRKNPPPPDPTRYNLSAWAIKLNEITPGLEGKLAPTDCRLRPDQHATEAGDYDEANQQKLRLETKQRAARKAAESGEAMRPRWFKPLGTTMGEGIAYEYHGGYWESRSSRQWEGCRDIFGE